MASIDIHFEGRLVGRCDTQKALSWRRGPHKAEIAFRYGISFYDDDGKRHTFPVHRIFMEGVRATRGSYMVQSIDDLELLFDFEGFEPICREELPTVHMIRTEFGLGLALVRPESVVRVSDT